MDWVMFWLADPSLGLSNPSRTCLRLPIRRALGVSRGENCRSTFCKRSGQRGQNVFRRPSTPFWFQPTAEFSKRRRNGKAQINIFLSVPALACFPNTLDSPHEVKSRGQMSIFCTHNYRSSVENELSYIWKKVCANYRVQTLHSLTWAWVAIFWCETKSMRPCWLLAMFLQVETRPWEGAELNHFPYVCLWETKPWVSSLSFKSCRHVSPLVKADWTTSPSEQNKW